MKQAIAKRWVKALRSGKYKQGFGQLKRGNRYCCLGVLCSIGRFRGWSDNGMLPLEVMKWAGIGDKCGRVIGHPPLTTLNDVKLLNFPEIADHIEKHWKEL